MSASPDPIFGHLIASYTRADALRDGTLTSANLGDLKKVTDEHFAELKTVPPVAVAAHLRAAILDAVFIGHDIGGIWHDVLTCAAMSAVKPSLHLARPFYDCLGHGARQWDFTVKIGTRTETVLCDIGPGDGGEPVVTLMLPRDN